MVEVMVRKLASGPSTEEELFNAFVEHATAHRDSFVEGNIKASNRAHDKLIKVAVEFRQIPDRGEHMLRELIRSSNESVRGWAAYFMLTLDEKLAVKTMRDIAKTTQSASVKITSETTLEEWRAGRLDVDWFLREL
jgi:hypothetical protein